MSPQLADFLTLILNGDGGGNLLPSSKCKQAFASYLQAVGIEFFNYGVFEMIGDRPSKAYFADTNFDPSWVEEYLTSSYAPDDYVLGRAKQLTPNNPTKSFRLGEWVIPHLSEDRSKTGAVLRGAADAGMKDGIGLIGTLPRRSGSEPLLHWGFGLGGEQGIGVHAMNLAPELMIAAQALMTRLKPELHACLDKAFQPLSPRERDVLACFANGKQRDRAAEALGISVFTVDLHSRNARQKLCAANVPEAIAKAYLYGQL